MLLIKSNPHQQAWMQISKESFGSICEVTHRKPWGFQEDDPNITNHLVSEFLDQNEFYGTIILHILKGEGESTERIVEVLNHAYATCIKLLILEHDPQEFIVEWVLSKKEKHREIQCGKNVIYCLSTMSPLHLPKLSDDYWKQHIGYRYVQQVDRPRAISLGIDPLSINGIDKEFFIYTHTSEEQMDFELPQGKIYWVIGGGLPYESLRPSNENILMDSTLLQVLYCASIYGVSKLEHIFPQIKEVGKGLLPYEPQGDDLNHWRMIKKNEAMPDSIIHQSLEDLDVSNSTIYVSTVNQENWEHLAASNCIVSSVFPRNRPTIF